jgi:hypothetical protein
MIARGDAIAGGAISDVGLRVLPGEWAGPQPILPSGNPARPRRVRRRIAHK